MTEIGDVQGRPASSRFHSGPPDPPQSVVPSTAQTVIPPPRGLDSPPAIRPRKMGGVTSEGVFHVLGAMAAGISVAILLFGVWASFSGIVGGFLVAYVVFLGTYAVLVSVTESGPAVRDRLATVGLWSITLLVLFALGSVIVTTIYKGHKPLLHWNFYTQDLSTTSFNSSFAKGGIKHALLGTLIQVGMALAFSVPLGIACAVYLSEVGGRLARLVRIVVGAMTALPSIVAGLFIYIFFIVELHLGHDGFAASAALAVTMVPIIIRSAEVVLRLVPGNLREAALALGAPRWRVAWSVVIPTSRSGLTTAVILGTAWGIGETAPVLLTAGYTTYTNTNPFHGPMVSLPLVAYELVRTGLTTYIARGFATASVLLILVVILFVAARTVGGRGPGHISRFGAIRIARASARDLQRFESRTGSTIDTSGMQPA